MSPEGKWFPKGRDPWRDFYTPEVMRKISAALRLPDDNLKSKMVLVGLHRHLCELGAKYLLALWDIEVSERPGKKNATYLQRSKWLKRNIHAPALMLLKALQPENQGWLSSFPDFEFGKFPLPPNFPALAKDLQQLADWSLALSEQFTANRNQVSRGAKSRPAKDPLNDLKYALVWDLTTIYVRIPDRYGKREARHPAITSIRIGNRQQPKGEFVDFIQAAAKPILGRSENLTDQAKAAARKFKERQSKSV